MQPSPNMVTYFHILLKAFVFSSPLLVFLYIQDSYVIAKAASPA